METNIEIIARNLDSNVTESFAGGFAEHDLTLKIDHYEDEWESFDPPPDLILLISAASWEIVFKPMVYDLIKTKFLQLWNNWIRSKKAGKSYIAFNAQIDQNNMINFSFSAEGSEGFTYKAFEEALKTVKEKIHSNHMNPSNNSDTSSNPIYNDKTEKWEFMDNTSEFFDDPIVDDFE